VVVDALRRAFRHDQGRTRDVKRWLGGLNEEDARIVLRSMAEGRMVDAGLWS
jgi:hypothetical protein